MNQDQPAPTQSVRQIGRKNRLWLLILPPLLSLSLVSLVRPAGRSAVMVELAIICLCSLFCGFALAFKSFTTTRQRVWGGLCFTGSSLYLISCVVFLGCISFSDTREPATPAQIRRMERQQEIQRQEQLAARTVPAVDDPLDLSPFYNLPPPGLPSVRDTPFRFLKPGIHIWDGIRFDVRGMIDPGFRTFAELEAARRGASAPDNGWAAKTNRIPVWRKCSEIDFLHGAFGRAGETMDSVSRFVIHFANGISVTVPIVFGRDVADSQFDPFADGAVLPANAVTWETRLEKNAPPRPVFGFYIKRWNNPFPRETVAAIDFEPTQGTDGAYSGAFLVAITIRPPPGAYP
jgi:hypothetical protein